MCLFLLLLILPRTFYFHAISQELLKIQTVRPITPLEPLPPAYVPFWGFVDIAPHFGSEIPPKTPIFRV